MTQTDMVHVCMECGGILQAEVYKGQTLIKPCSHCRTLVGYVSPSTDHISCLVLKPRAPGTKGPTVHYGGAWNPEED